MKVTVQMVPPPTADEATDERVLTLPENVTLTATPASPEAYAVVAAMAERILTEQGYHEMADEMLALAREARAAQIRALADE